MPQSNLFFNYLEQLHIWFAEEIVNQLKIPSAENLTSILFPFVDRLLILFSVLQTIQCRDQATLEDRMFYEANFMGHRPILSMNENDPTFWNVLRARLHIQLHRDCPNVDDWAGWKHAELAQSLLTLQEGYWLDDFAINSYLSLLCCQNGQCAFLASNVWQSHRHNRHWRVPRQNWRLDEMILVFVPILLEVVDQHRSMIVVDVRKGLLMMMEPQGKSVSQQEQSAIHLNIMYVGDDIFTSNNNGQS